MSFNKLLKIGLRSRVHHLNIRSTYTTCNPTSRLGRVFVKGVTPHYLGWLDPRLYLPDSLYGDPLRLKEGDIPSTLPFGAKLKGMIYRGKEGGVILELEYLDPKAQVQPVEVVKRLASELEHHFVVENRKGFLNLFKLRVFPIKGEPFLEDLTSSLPTR